MEKKSDQAHTRRLAAILHADVAGYSRLMGVDEAETHRRLVAALSDIDAIVADADGRVVGRAGDAVLAEFPSAIQAFQAAQGIQAAMAEANRGVAPDRRMDFRIGLNLGDIIVDGETIYGDGVNVAARVEAMAPPGGIALTAAVYEQIRDRLKVRVRSLGRQQAKNIFRPFDVYVVDDPAIGGALSTRRIGRRRIGLAAGLALLLILAAGGAFWALDGPTAPGRGSASGAAEAVAPADGQGDASGSDLGAGQEGEPMLAVLPFDDLSAIDERSIIAAGVTEDIIADLGRFSNLLVLSWNAVAQYADQAVDPRTLAEELGVRYVVGGSVRRLSDQIRVSVQVTDAREGVLLWSERYDAPLDDLFTVQDTIVNDVVTALALNVARIEQERIAEQPTTDLDAYESALRGWDALRAVERMANAEARQAFERALEIDPGYADAMAGLATSHVYDFLFGWTDRPYRAIERAGALAEAAIEEEPTNGLGHALLAFTLYYRRDYDQALREIDRALDLNPNEPLSLAISGIILSNSGQSEAALEPLERAVQLEAAAASWWVVGLAEAYYLRGRYEDAVDVVEEHLRWFQEDPAGFVILAAAHGQLGNMEEAREAADQLRRVSPFLQAEAYASVFRREEDRAHVTEGLRAAGLD